MRRPSEAIDEKMNFERSSVVLTRRRNKSM